ncbi:glycosyltransferase [Microbacterium marmarense]|uniref:Glycosyltransferase n=1 Tax=Microbacterium marmarense TaxID=3122051 RepID=A0ABU8LWW4_9MICO
MPSIAIIGTRGYPSYYGGFETAVRKLAPFLADQGWDVTVYCRPGATRLDDPGRDHRIHVVETKGVERKSLSTLTYGLTAAHDASKKKPDVALVMNVANGYWLPLLKRAGIPTVVNVDGIEWDRAKWGKLAKWMFRMGAKLTAKYGTELVVDAHAIGDRWQTDFDRGGVYLPYGGDKWAPLKTPIDLQRRRYVLMVARFVPENSIVEFFDAVPSIAESAPVIIVGSTGYGGDLDQRARELAEAHSNVRWLGHVSDDELLAALWQNCGAYFHGHTVGGTNPALVQAMAAGAPVVAVDTVYNREVLGDDSQTCARDADSILESIDALLNDPARQERMSRTNIRRADDQFSWDAICRGYESTLRKVSCIAESAIGSSDEVR